MNFLWNCRVNSGLHLSCTWPIFAEELVTENEDCNDFNPILSQQWAVGMTLVEDLPVLLADAVDEYFKLSVRRETIEQLLGKLQHVDGRISSMDRNKCNHDPFVSIRDNEQHNEHGRSNQTHNGQPYATILDVDIIVNIEYNGTFTCQCVQFATRKQRCRENTRVFVR
jgi:hypothetical protein